MNKWVLYIGFVGAFFLGRHLAPTKTVTLTKEVVRYEKTKEVRKRREITVVKRADGSISHSSIESSSTHFIRNSTRNINKTTISGGINADSTISVLVSNRSYGLHASKKILGPISIGAFTLSDGTIGCSAGLSF